MAISAQHRLNARSAFSFKFFFTWLAAILVALALVFSPLSSGFAAAVEDADGTAVTSGSTSSSGSDTDITDTEGAGASSASNSSSDSTGSSSEIADDPASTNAGSSDDTDAGSGSGGAQNGGQVAATGSDHDGDQTGGDQLAPSTSREAGDAAEVTEAELLTLSNQGQLTEAYVAENLSGVLDTATIPLNIFEFDTDMTSPAKPDPKAVAAAALNNPDTIPDTIEGGELAAIFKNPISVNVSGSDYSFTYQGVTIDGIEVYFIGTIKIKGQTYVYYITDTEVTNKTVYTVLDPNETGPQLKVSYSRGDHYTIEYATKDVTEDQDNNAEGKSIGSYDLDQVFGVNRPTYLDVAVSSTSVQDSYRVNVQIPRGYQATVKVYNVNGDSKTQNDKVSLTLGKMMEYQLPSPEGSSSGSGVIGLDPDSPKSVILSGTVTVTDVSSNQKVVVEYKKISSYTFSAVAWMNTANAGGRDDNAENGVLTTRIRDMELICSSDGKETSETNVTSRDDAECTFDAGSDSKGASFTWKFKSRTQSTWESTYILNYLQFNGEYIATPILPEIGTDPVSTDTVLSTGTEVTVTAKNDADTAHDSYGTGGKKIEYTIEVTNCFENITVSAGNMVAHHHAEVSIESVGGVSNLRAWNDSDSSWWSGSDADSESLSAGNRVASSQSSVSQLVFQFKHDAGYFLPNIKVVDANNGPVDSAIQWLQLRLSLGYTVDDNGNIKNSSGQTVVLGSGTGKTAINTVFEEVTRDELTAEPDQVYFFRFSEEVTEKWNSSSSSFTDGAYKRLYVYCEASPMLFEVQYDRGADATGASAPTDDSIVNMPDTDTNSDAYYSVTDANIVSISSLMPTDKSDNYVFDGWQVVSAAFSDVVVDDDDGPIVLLAGSVLDLQEALHDWLHKAVVHPANEESPASFTLRATWRAASAGEGNRIDYTVDYVLDGESIQLTDFTANAGAQMVISVFEPNNVSGTSSTGGVSEPSASDLKFTDALQEILTTAGGQDYTLGGKADIDLEQVQVESKSNLDVFWPDALTQGAVIDLSPNTAITVYLNTMIDVKYRFVAEATASAPLPDSTDSGTPLAQLASALEETGSVDAKVTYRAVQNELYNTSFNSYDDDIDKMGNRGTWEFVSWDSTDISDLDRATAVTEGVTFTGTWKLDTYKVAYTYDEGGNAGSYQLPTDSDAPTAPTDSKTYAKSDYIPMPTLTSEQQSVDTNLDDSGNRGTWVFDEWQLGGSLFTANSIKFQSQAKSSGDTGKEYQVTVTGLWNLERYWVAYDFQMDPSLTSVALMGLPGGVTGQVPSRSATSYAAGDGTSGSGNARIEFPDSSTFTKVDATVDQLTYNRGTWVFDAWGTSSIDRIGSQSGLTSDASGNHTLTVTGIWNLDRYYLDYSFQSATSGSQLPSTGTGVGTDKFPPAPSDGKSYAAGDGTSGTGDTQIRLASLNVASVDVCDNSGSDTNSNQCGTWEFTGWNPNTIDTIGSSATEDADNSHRYTLGVSGSWQYSSYTVKYEFTNGTDSYPLPSEVTGLLPTDSATYAKTGTVTVQNPSSTSVDVPDSSGSSSTWTFAGWTVTVSSGTAPSITDGKVMLSGQDITLVGEWLKSAYVVTYEWAMEVAEVSDPAADGYFLPNGVTSQVSQADFASSYGLASTVEAPRINDTDVDAYLEKTSSGVEDETGDRGTWVFQGWTLKNGNSFTSGDTTVSDGLDEANGNTVTLVGTWKLERYYAAYEYRAGNTADGYQLVTSGSSAVVTVPSDSKSYAAGDKLTISTIAVTPSGDDASRNADLVMSGSTDGNRGTWVFDTWDVQESDTFGSIAEDESISADTDGKYYVPVTGLWELHRYWVDYQFVSATSGRNLPSEVLELLPSDEVSHAAGDVVDPVAGLEPGFEVSADGGIWYFAGWDAASVTVADAEVASFVGAWSFATASVQPHPDTNPGGDEQQDPTPDDGTGDGNGYETSASDSDGDALARTGAMLPGGLWVVLLLIALLSAGGLFLIARNRSKEEEPESAR